ncbi:hypothetical protein [Polyangium sp. y55x31]|uniref:hypothetical protein n=1 Tax=Polyangium sp. y55x31 TaxID=3042688 RepID=UPI002482A9F3|nr:hypothetical protein [Polyangium sp. y55x31]MDI1483587.1 hypothetical protein [Polyangium sp. y55x31]
MDPNEMQIELYARPGTHPRTLLISAVTNREDLSTAEPLPEEYVPHVEVEGMLARYAAAATMGCFGGTGSASITQRERRTEGTTTVERLILSLPALPLEALAPLLWKARFPAFLDRPLRSFVVTEQGAESMAAVDIDALALLPEPTLRFTVALPEDLNEELKDGRVLVTFVEAVREDTLARTRDAFEAWGGLLVGGFPGPHEELPSAGFVTDVQRHLPTEVVASLEFVSASRPAWDALLRTLDRINRDLQPIVKVEVY